MNSCRKPENANSATPLLPGVGLISMMTHITSCRAKMTRCSEVVANHPWSVVTKARMRKFTTRYLDIQDAYVAAKDLAQYPKGSPFNSRLVVMISSPISMTWYRHFLKKGSRKICRSMYLKPRGTKNTAIKMVVVRKTMKKYPTQNIPTVPSSMPNRVRCKFTGNNMSMSTASKTTITMVM